MPNRLWESQRVSVPPLTARAKRGVVERNEEVDNDEGCGRLIKTRIASYLCLLLALAPAVQSSRSIVCLTRMDVMRDSKW
jgi:hypothetical protein